MTASQLKGQAEYLDDPQYQNDEWFQDFEAFLARIASSACTNPQVRQKLIADKTKLDQVRTIYREQFQAA
jgi:hypothetical protein